MTEQPRQDRAAAPATAAPPAAWADNLKDAPPSVRELMAEDAIATAAARGYDLKASESFRSLAALNTGLERFALAGQSAAPFNVGASPGVRELMAEDATASFNSLAVQGAAERFSVLEQQGMQSFAESIRPTQDEQFAAINQPYSTSLTPESPSTQPEMISLPFNLPPSPTERIAAQLRALPLAVTLPADLDRAAAMLARQYDPRALIAALERILAAAAETGVTQ